MIAVLPTLADWPLYDIAASRQLEAVALAAQPAHALIERAGLAVARLAQALVPHGRRAWVLAGPGNNGGDGLVAARWLAAQGWQIQVNLIGPAPRPGSDAAHALQAAQAAGLPIQPGLPPFPPAADLVIDALLGLGASRAPEDEMAAAIAAINACGSPDGQAAHTHTVHAAHVAHADNAGGNPGNPGQSPRVLAVDLPSGLCADSGRLLGNVAVQAHHTLSLLNLKPGLFTAEGRAQCGRIWFDDLGTQATGAATSPPHHATPMRSEPLANSAPAPSAPTAWLGGLGAMQAWQQRHQRRASSHKGRQGDVLVLGGAHGMRGAAWLAATAALASGAGRVHAALPDDDGQPWPARPELMRWDFHRWADVPAWRDAVLVAGCGGGQAIAPWLDAVLREAHRLVLDADALNLVAAEPALARRLRARQGRGQHTVLTPHPLEAARLLGHADARAVQAQRLEAARQLAEQTQCCVVLKGSGSVIAAPAETADCATSTSADPAAGAHNAPVINSTGSAALATAGSGDVLAGWLGGLWAQAPGTPAMELARVAVAWHGAAAEGHAGPLLAADLVTAMAARHALPSG